MTTWRPLGRTRISSSEENYSCVLLNTPLEPIGCDLSSILACRVCTGRLTYSAAQQPARGNNHPRHDHVRQGGWLGWEQLQQMVDSLGHPPAQLWEASEISLCPVLQSRRWAPTWASTEFDHDHPDATKQAVQWPGFLTTGCLVRSSTCTFKRITSRSRTEADA